MPRPTSRRTTRALFWAFILLLAASAGWVARGWRSPTGPESAPSGEPNAARVVKSRFEQTVKARGIVKPAPNALVRVGFPMPKDVSRRIQTMRVVEGDVVKAGDELAALDHADLLATLRQLKADAVVAEKRLAAARTLEPVEINVAKAQVDQAKASAELARRNFERAEKAHAAGTAAQLDYDTALNDVQVTKAKRESAEATLQQVKARFQTDIATLEAQVEQVKAAVHSAEVQIGWSTIRSPIDGVVFAVHQRPGELTSNQPAAPVLTLLDPAQLQVHLYVDESDFGKVRVGQEALLRVEAHAGETVGGKVVRLLPQPILQENVVYYLAVVEADATKRSLLRAEMTTLAHIQVGSKTPVLWVPLSAVKSRVVRPAPHPGRAGRDACADRRTERGPGGNPLRSVRGR